MVAESGCVAEAWHGAEGEGGDGALASAVEDWGNGTACVAEGWEAEVEAEWGLAVGGAESACGKGGGDEGDEAVCCAVEGGESADLLAAELETGRRWLTGWLLLLLPLLGGL